MHSLSCDYILTFTLQKIIIRDIAHNNWPQAESLVAVRDGDFSFSVSIVHIVCILGPTLWYRWRKSGLVVLVQFLVYNYIECRNWSREGCKILEAGTSMALAACIHQPPTMAHTVFCSLNQSATTATEWQEDNAELTASNKNINDANNDDNKKQQIINKNYNQLFARGNCDINMKLQWHAEACTVMGTAYDIVAVSWQGS